MPIIELIVLCVIAMCLLGTCIWWFDAKVNIPGPFGWMKGLLSWLMVVGACYVIWLLLIGPYVLGHGHR